MSNGRRFYRNLMASLLLPILLTFGSEVLNEELTITRLPSGNLAAFFRFVTSGVDGNFHGETHLFPPIFVELINKYGLAELSLSLTQGNWKTGKWGLPLFPSSPHGALLHAWLQQNHSTKETVDCRWSSLVTSLNGLFCTSLSSAFPALSSDLPVDAPPHPPGPSENLLLRQAQLAEETVCTENLTPFRKLLPCKQSGLVSLLNPFRIYDSAFHSMAFRVYRTCTGDAQVCQTPTWNIDWAAAVVFDLPVKYRSVDWSLDILFGRSISKVCAAANSSTLIVNDDHFEPTFEKTANATVKRGPSIYHQFDLKATKEASTNFVAKYKERSLPLDRRVKQLQTVSLAASVLGGEASRSGVLQFSAHSSLPGTRRVRVAASVPWFAELHFASVQLVCHDEKGTEFSPLVFRRFFLPALRRLRPAHIEYEFEMSTNSYCSLSVGFDRVFMRLGEYPSDANHGKYLPPAALAVLDGEGRLPLLAWSGPLLLALPVPDFSMPFNVEAFVCIVVSLCFTPLLNYTAYILLPCGQTHPLPSLSRRLLRVFLLVVTSASLYAEYSGINPSQLMRYGRKAVHAATEAINKTIFFPDPVPPLRPGIAQ